MKIISLAFSLGGGGGRILARIVEGTQQFKHVIGIVQDDPVYNTGADKIITGLGLPINRINRENAQRWVRKLKPDLVVYHWWPLERGEFTPESLKSGAPVILVSHYTRKVPEGFDYYVSVSRHGLEYMRHIPGKKIEIIYNGIDVSKYENNRIAHDGFVIGRVSSLEEKKVPPDYIRFLNSIRIPEAKFVFVGDGNRRESLAREAEKINPEKFIFTGRVDNDEVRKSLGTFDLSCYLTGTHLGSHSISLLEKMASGIPIVAEARGGIPEQVFHGETGFLANDREKIRYYCELLHREPRLRSEFAENSARIAREIFPLEKMLKQYSELFQRITHENSFLDRLLGRRGRTKNNAQPDPGNARG